MPTISRREILKSILLASVSGFTSLIGTPGFGSTNRRVYEDFEPGYVKLYKSGALKQRGEKLWASMESCELCPRMCGVNKLAGEKGFCRAGRQLEVSSFHPHFGEEAPLVGPGGSGTIFLTHCGLRCVFCINWAVSHNGEGSVTSIDALSQMMLTLQRKGCANINFVTPTHYSPHILLGLDKAAAGGLRLPVVYNTCGWERPEILRMLDGVVDIYLPDFKYSDGKKAAKYSSGADNYVGFTQQAILEMYRQVGTARSKKGGLINRGLMIRHLVMPNNVGGTKEVIDWIAENLPKDTYLNLMSQYRPMYKAFGYPEISRKITRKEYEQAIHWARAAGLTNLDIQGYH